MPIRHSGLWLGFMVVCCVACAQDPPGQDSSAAPDRSTLQQHGTHPPIVHRTATIDWDAARAFRQLPRSALPSSLSKGLAGAPVPALVPARSILLSAAKPTRGPSWYAVSMPAQDHTVFITGNRDEVVIPGVSTRAAPRADFHPLISRTRGIVNASFTAFGVAYAISVECAQPFTDTRCTGDEYVRALVAELALAGGAS